MIINKFTGRCSCGILVPAGKGYVLNRRIVCAEHGEIAADADVMFDPDEGLHDDYRGVGMYGFDE